MKNWKSLPLLFIALIAIGCLTSCGEDRAVEAAVEGYEVDVAIVSPNNNALMAVGENFNVEVDFARNENIIHNIKVEIVDMNGNQIENLVERHAHVANEFTFTADGIKIDQAGTYLVRASTTDFHVGDEGEEHGEGAGHGEGEVKEENNLVEHTITVQ